MQNYRQAKEFATEEALKKYLKEHPLADRRNHSVVKHDSKAKGDEEIESLPDDATVRDLPKKVREEIAEYKISIVGDNAKKALEIARKLKRGISRAADICQMSSSVCKGNKGLTRDKMPQIEGEKTVKQLLNSDKAEDRAKGEAMVQAGADPNSDKTILQLMLDHLKDHGIKTTQTEMPVGRLKATQSEIKADKVFGMADAHLRGKFDNIDASVVVSKDGHILDGHHRWAALLTIDPARKMKVRVVDMTMDELLKEAAAFPGVYKADFNGKPLSESDQKKYKSENKSKFRSSSKKKDKSKNEEKHVQRVASALVRRAAAPIRIEFNSPRVEFDGSLTITPDGDIVGMVDVLNLGLSRLGRKTEADIAGTVLVTKVDPAAQKLAKINGEIDASIKSMESLTVPSGADVRRIKVKGTLVTAQGRKVAFFGTFHPTGYFQTAWSELNFDRSVEALESLIKLAKDFATEEALKKYLKEHPNADRRNHTVVKNDQKPKKDEAPKKTKSLFSPEQVKDLPVNAHQKISDPKKLFEVAKKAHEQQIDLLNRGKGLDKLVDGVVIRADQGDKVDYDKPGPVILIGPMKKLERSKEKVESKYGGDWSRLVDIVRASVAVDSFDQVKDVVAKLNKLGLKLANQPEDRFAKPTDAGYRDLSFNVVYPNGHVGELQIHVKSVLKAKDAGHKFYEKVRSIEASAKKEGRNTLTAEEQSIVDEANQKMRDLYGRAWAEATGGSKAVDKSAASVTAAKRKYYIFDGVPAYLDHRKFPTIINPQGKEVTWYDLEKFFREADPVTQKQFENLKPSSKKKASLSALASLEALARFERGVPADPTQNMSPEDAEKWQNMNEKYKDKFKTAAQSDPLDALSRLAKFEEGVPADPTENMDAEDAEVWEEMNEEHGDQFKEAAPQVPGTNRSWDNVPVRPVGKIRIFRFTSDVMGDKGTMVRALMGVPIRSDNEILLDLINPDSRARERLFKQVMNTHIGQTLKFALLDEVINRALSNILIGETEPEIDTIPLSGHEMVLNHPPKLLDGTIIMDVAMIVQEASGQPLRLASSDADPLEALARLARFEEGVPADPTKNMDPEDAEKWEEMNEKYKDKFKAAKLTTHLEGNSGKTKCGEKADPRTLVDSVKDATCFYCKQQWERDHSMKASSKTAARVLNHEANDVDFDYPGSWFSIDGITPDEGEELAAELSTKLPLGWTARWDSREDVIEVLPKNILYGFSEQAYRKWEAYHHQKVLRILNALLARSDFRKNARSITAAPKGLYGFTKSVQSDCESCVRKLQRTADSIARKAWRKDENVAAFLQIHAKRANSLPARILVAAMKNLGPKIADEIEERIEEAEAEEVRQERTAAAKKSRYGLYGFSAKTSSLGLTAITQLREAAGHLAGDLHNRRADRHEMITGFFKTHQKQARCLYSGLLCASYPDNEFQLKTASGRVSNWLTWEE